MNKKIIAIVVITIVFTISIGVFVVQNRTKQSNQQPSQLAQDNNQPTIDTNDWSIFKNDGFRFEMKYPKNLTYAPQNEVKPSAVASFLFYDNKFSDVAKASNPLLAIIDKKSSYIELIVLSRKDFVDKSNFDIKSFVARSLGGPGGGATQKLLEWIPAKTTDEKVVVYFYTTDVTDADTLQSLGQSKGVAWMSNGALFLLEPKGDVQQIGDLYKDIARTFSQR
jgi:hypothetical protein